MHVFGLFYMLFCSQITAYLLDSFKPLFSGIFEPFVYYLFITQKSSYAPLLLYYTSE